MILHPPTPTLFPYTTLFRSGAGVYEFPEQTDAGNGAGFAWTDSRDGAGSHAALADRRLHGHWQECVHQLADDVDPIQGESGRSEDGAGGPQAVGAKSLREHSSLDRAGGDRSEDRFECVAKCDA